MNQENNSYGAKIERGKITHADEDGYIVQSYDRNGLVTPKIKTLFGYKYDAGDRVYFILADDGSGKIICAMGENKDGQPSNNIDLETLKNLISDAVSEQINEAVQGIKYPVTSVNKKTGDVVLKASDVGARSSSWMPTAAQVGARPADWMPTAADVGARPNTWTPSASDVGALPSGGTAVNASKLGNKTWANLKLEMFPVGSIYVTDSTTSPAGYIGGTWERIDKSFPSGSSTATFFKPASGVTLSSCYFSRSGHSISYRFTLSCSSDLTDTAFTLGTVDFAVLGVSGFNCDQYIIGNSDTGNGLSMATIDSETGEVIHKERIVNGGGNIAADSDIVYKGVIVSNQGRMLNAVCNQFVYRRIS